MAKLKSELSVRNQYYIPKHRYYELRHFCLQYPEWCAARNAVGCISSTDISGVSVKQNCSDPVARAAEMRLFYENRMNMIDRIAKETDPSLYSYILSHTLRGEQAIEVLDSKPVIFSADAEYIRAKSYYRIGQKENARLKICFV